MYSIYRVIDTILDMHMTNISWDKEFRYVYRYTFNLFSFVVLYLVHRLSLYYIGYNVYRHFQPYFSYIVANSFIGGRNRSTQRKPPTCHKSLTNCIT